MSTQPSNHSLRQTALELVSSIIPIRPLLPGLKRPWSVDGKALTLSKWDDVDSFWREHPNANVGACTAPIDHSPIIVVDIDICDVPVEERPRVWTRLGEVGVTSDGPVWVQRTGRDNWQVFYYALDMPYIPLRHVNAGQLHIDLISNGYVVVAPSDTSGEQPKAPGKKGGGLYRWRKGPWDIPLSAVQAPPAGLIEWWKQETAQPSPPALQNVTRAAATDMDIDGPIISEERGQGISHYRNVRLTAIAGAVMSRFGPSESADRVHHINQQRVRPPLPDHEVDTIIRSINGREDGSRSRVLGEIDDETQFMG